MKNLIYGMVAVMLSIFVVSCSQTEITHIDEEISQEELINLKAALENSEELNALRSTNETFVEELRAGKVEFFDLYTEISAEGISLECQSLATYETSLKGLDIFRNFVCDYSDLKFAISEKFEVLSQLDRNQLEFVFGYEAVSREFDCGDVFTISLEFYDIQTAVWAYYECCEDEFFFGCL